MVVQGFVELTYLAVGSPSSVFAAGGRCQSRSLPML